MDWFYATLFFDRSNLSVDANRETLKIINTMEEYTTNEVILPFYSYKKAFNDLILQPKKLKNIDDLKRLHRILMLTEKGNQLRELIYSI
jgi:hypothetical protein